MNSDLQQNTEEQIITDLNTNTIKPIEIDIQKKKRNTSFSLSLSNTFNTNRIKCPDLHDPMEIGGWACIKCKELIDHDDCVGTPESHGFKVYGYHCHKCGHRWLREKYVDMETRCGQSFMTMGKWELKRISTHTKDINQNNHNNV